MWSQTWQASNTQERPTQNKGCNKTIGNRKGTVTLSSMRSKAAVSKHWKQT